MIIYKDKPKPSSLLEILKNRPQEVKKHCTYEWQDKAFEIADKLHIDFKKHRTQLGSWLNLFKTAYSKGRQGKLDSCYSFISDYPKDLDSSGKIKLFYWKYGQKKI